MTTAEACQLLLTRTREVSAARRERDAYQLIACRLAAHAHRLWQEREEIEERYHRTLDENRYLRAHVVSRSQEAA